jgi:hypothetical protein
MTQPISGFRRAEDAWSGALGDESGSGARTPGTSPGTRAAARLVPEPLVPPPPPPPLTTAGRRGVGTAAPVADTAQAARDAVTQRRLEAFRTAATAPVLTRHGLAYPGLPFRMATPYPDQAQHIRKNLQALASAAVRGGVSTAGLSRIQSGRGSPTDIGALVGALVRAPAAANDELPPLPAAGPALDRAVRQMMFEHGLGLDCAGYVQQAYLRATGLDRRTAGFGTPLNENLSNLGSRGFSRVGDPASARPGDIFVLGHELGDPTSPEHRAIVYAQRPATRGDVSQLLTYGKPAEQFARGNSVRVLEVDSSWGCHDDPQQGGVQRETWWYAETTRTWGWLSHGSGANGSQSPDAFQSGPTPYNHVFGGPYAIYRGRTGEP